MRAHTRICLASFGWPLMAAAVVVAQPTAAGIQQPAPPAVIKHVPPIYPEAARQRAIHGAVMVEATIGADGKVTDARVVRSIPELDAAAVAAVRQWEFRPTLVDGVAVPVLMTVTVNFTLTDADNRPLPRPDLILKHDGQVWSLNGRVVNNQLADVLRPVLESRREKLVIVEVPAALSYSSLIAVLAEAVSSGVERFLLMQPSDNLADAVAVQLHGGAGLDRDLRLPVADVPLDPTPSPVVIRLPADGAPDPDPAAALQNIGRGAVVALQVDASRSVADVWEVLRLGKARGADVFSLEVEHPEGPGSVARRCREGSAEDCGMLGFWYLTGSRGLSVDYDTAITLLRRGCDAKSAMSCGMLAEVYEQGMGVEKNRQEGIRLLTESCRLGGSPSCDVLRARGLPVPKPESH